MIDEAIKSLIRPNILKLTPYSSARSEFGGNANVFLDANENPNDNGYNRYPDPLQCELKELLKDIKGVPTENIFIGNGSDEAIDLCFRIFCRPGIDNAICLSPTYGMYQVAAEINDVEIRSVPLNADFTLPVDNILKSADSKSKLLFICSPNNPTGNAFSTKDILQIANEFRGIVVIDEAYIDFSSQPSLIHCIFDEPNIIVLQTLSKAWGMAGLRVGFAYADADIIRIMNAVKYPYNVNVASQRKAIEILKLRLADKQIAEILSERDKMREELGTIKCVKKVYPSDANFLLVETDDAKAIYQYLLRNGVVVRDRSSVPGCAGCLRITIGTPNENRQVITLLRDYCTSETGPTPILKDRKATVHRKTRETDITVKVDLEGKSTSHISTGLNFLDHMLDQIVHHGGISLEIDAKGDLQVDAHHTIEDTAITLGEAMHDALGDKRGIERYGFTLPMDECRAQVLIDLGGRIDFDWDVPFTMDMIGDVPSEMFKHFFKSLCAAMKCNLHIIAKGENNHHLAEAVFKAFARALRMAVYRQPGNDKLPSSKGELW